MDKQNNQDGKGKSGGCPAEDPLKTMAADLAGLKEAVAKLSTGKDCGIPSSSSTTGKTDDLKK